jgi:diaminopimelate dehydrogenase
MAREKTKVANVGWGNVGRGVYQAIQRNSDMELSFVLSRNSMRVIKECREKGYSILANQIRKADSDLDVKVVQGLGVDVAVLCGGSATDLPTQGPHFASYFNTVDSFDTHADIADYDIKMDRASRSKGNTSVICAGWDPGTFSLERVLGNSFVPGSKAYTFWGKGVSQGHSQAVRAVEGVLNGIQYTVPVQEALDAVRSGINPELTTRQKHTREVFIALKPGADETKVRETITAMPKYFSDYNTTITVETPEQIEERLSSMPHGGFVLTSGKTGKGNNSLIEYSNQWASNPEATGSILVACARACHRLNRD